MEDNRSDYERFGYKHERPRGEADSYYSEALPDQGERLLYQHGNDGPTGEGERGLMGALAGGAAGAYGGHQLGGNMTGHSKTSAVIGAVAGAIAGHKLQNTVSEWREDKKEEKEEEKYDHDQNHNHNNGNHNCGQDNESMSIGRNYAGNYSQSSTDIHLDAHGDYNLTAKCRDLEGAYHLSTISLNRILANDRGRFHWTSGGGETMIIQPGDTLRGVAARFNCSFEDIARMNNIENPDMIYPGQVLQIPGGGGCGNFGSSAQNVRLVDDGRRLEAELRREDGNWITSSVVLDEMISNDNGSLRLL